jgi:hypothetical protein
MSAAPVPLQPPIALPWVGPAWVRSQLIGRDAPIHTLFGERRIVYAAHVASARSLQWIEDFIAAHVLPQCRSPAPGRSCSWDWRRSWTTVSRVTVSATSCERLGLGRIYR